MIWLTLINSDRWSFNNKTGAGGLAAILLRFCHFSVLRCLHGRAVTGRGLPGHVFKRPVKMRGILIAHRQRDVQQLEGGVLHHLFGPSDPEVQDIIPHRDVHLLFEEEAEIIGVQPELGGDIRQQQLFRIMAVYVGLGPFHQIFVVVLLQDFQLADVEQQDLAEPLFQLAQVGLALDLGGQVVFRQLILSYDFDQAAVFLHQRVGEIGKRFL